MDITYLQNILAEVVLLDHTQHRELERLKIKTIEAFKVLFPEDKPLITLVQNLKFDLFEQMPNGHFRDMVLNSINKLKSVVETKIEFLKHLPASKTLHELEQDNQYQVSKIKQHEHTIEKYKTELEKADERLVVEGRIHSDQVIKIQTLEAEVKKRGITSMVKNGTFWTLVGTFMIGVPLWTFDRGKEFGSQKVDEERLQLKDSVKTLNNKIEYLRQNSDSALNSIASMPYDELKLDTFQFRRVQSTIERGGHFLDLNKK